LEIQNVFLWKRKSNEVIEFTFSKETYNEIGFIGIDKSNEGPNLCDMNMSSHMCNEGDVIIMVTSSVYYNFHPKYQGKNPTDFGYEKNKWDELDEEQVILSQIICNTISEKLNEIRSPKPSRITKKNIKVL